MINLELLHWKQNILERNHKIFLLRKNILLDHLFFILVEPSSFDASG